MKRERDPFEPDLRQEERSALSRRRFLHWLGWGSLGLAGGSFSVGAGAFIFPRMTLEPSRSYAVGKPEDFRVGEMRLIESRQVFIFRNEQGFQAVSGICTHLGCAYQPYGPDDQTYTAVHAHCPCHGSVFHRDGSVLKGPAPKPLPFYAMALSSDGRLIVDESVNDGTHWAGIDHRIYLTPQGEQIVGPLPQGEEINFG